MAAQLFMGQARAQDQGGVGCPLQDRAPGSAIVVGRVLDAASETPLPGAFVRLRWDGGDEHRTTDPEGHFLMCSVPTGVEIDARSHFPGRAASTTFTIGAGDPQRERRVGMSRPRLRGAAFSLALGAPSTLPTPRVISGYGDLGFEGLQPPELSPAPMWDLNSRIVVSDGVRHRDTCILNFVRPADVESIVVVPGIFGATTFGSIGIGAIVITTKDALRRPGEPSE